ncbi:hypothetical protein NOVO_01005 [Rickettsiales bacterium Ac37b]|nr:hypothetical protein NOVO_01005 [Rickettsiales bacterium Ac37b]
MINILLLPAIILLNIASFIAYANDKSLNEELTVQSLKELHQPNLLYHSNLLKVQLSTNDKISSFKNKEITFKLLQSTNNLPISMDSIEPIHGPKLHAYVINSSFTDYHHLYPVPLKSQDQLYFSFIPKTNELYHLWITMKIISTAREEYVYTQLNTNSTYNNYLSPIENLSANIGNYYFKLTFSEPLKLYSPINAKIIISKQPTLKQTENLEKINYELVNIIGFYYKNNAIFHLHPTNSFSSSTDQAWDFHWIPEYHDIAKIFFEFKIHGQIFKL